MGEIVYVFKCTSVPIQPRSSEKCYQELPIIANEKEGFLSPITRILTETGTEIACVSGMSSHFNIQGVWWSRNPRLSKTLPPTELDPNVNNNPIIFQPLFQVGSMGLYTTSELNALHRELMFPIIRRAYTDNVYRVKLGTDSSETSMFDNLSESDITSLTDLIGGRISWFFSMFGHWASIVIGVS